jgi:hypothetical protein
MNHKAPWRALAASLLVLALVACGGGGSSAATGTGTDSAGGPTDTPDPTGSPGTPGSTGTHAGMGASSAAPTGQPLALPPGVQLEKPIKGENADCVPKDQKDTPRTGSGGYVHLCLGFRNSTALPITVVLPPGLIFVSDDQAYQNGILLQVTTIEVPAGSAVYYVPLFLYCLNEGRMPTVGPQNTYSTGPVSDDGAVLELLSLLKDKPLPLLTDLTAQEALWHITDGDGLTQDDRSAIAGRE